MNVRRLAAALSLACATLLATAAPAAAHVELVESTPGADTSLAAPPGEVRLVFSGAVTVAANPLTVTGPGGETWTIGAAEVDGAVLTAPVEPAGPAGTHTLTYRVVAGDGAEVSGTVRFTLTADARESGGIPTWVWFVLGLVALAGGALLLVGNRRAHTGQ